MTTTSRWMSLLITIVAGLVVVGVGVTAVIILLDKPAPPAISDEARIATERDAVLVTGQDAARVLNTVDYREAQQTLQRWQAVSTGGLLADLTGKHAEYKAKLEQSTAVSVATAREAALSKFDRAQGTAVLLVSVEVKVQGPSPSTKKQAVRLAMKRTAEGWRAETLAPVTT